MKAETTEWTGHGTTKFISENNGGYTGMSTYLTDNQEIAPSFTFYLYHAKNITLDSDLGTVVTGKTPSKSNKAFYGDYALFLKPTDISE